MEIENSNKGLEIKAYIVSSPNATNGIYSACGLDQLVSTNLVKVKDDDLFYLESLKMQADLADKMIAEAEEQGQDISDLNVLSELGKQIKSKGTPIHLKENITIAFLVSFQLIVLYIISIGVWSLVFKAKFWVFAIIGAILGIFISIFSSPVIITKRTKERVKEIIFGIASIFTNLGIVICILGLIAWVIRLIFFE